MEDVPKGGPHQLQTQPWIKSMIEFFVSAFDFRISI